MTELILRNFSENALAKLNLTPEDRERLRRKLARLQIRAGSEAAEAGVFTATTDPSRNAAHRGPDRLSYEQGDA